jgi:hypothetical protein
LAKRVIRLIRKERNKKERTKKEALKKKDVCRSKKEVIKDMVY